MRTRSKVLRPSDRVLGSPRLRPAPPGSPGSRGFSASGRQAEVQLDGQG